MLKLTKVPTDLCADKKDARKNLLISQPWAKDRHHISLGEAEGLFSPGRESWFGVNHEVLHGNTD